MTGRRVWPLALCLALATSPVAAQGRSDSAPGHTKDTSQSKDKASAASQSSIPSPSTATSSPASSASKVLYYGSWLDDASIVPPGGAWIGLSTGYWKAGTSRQIDAPVVSAVVGLHRRAQVGGSLPIYHFHDDSGLSENGLGNIAFYGKLRLIDPEANSSRVGMAIAPLLEVVTSGTDSLGWALPLNVEIRRSNLRMYGSGGYFSRGSVFATVAIEVPAGSRASITGNFGQSYARAGSHQTSLGVSAFVSTGATSGFFVGLGRTLSPLEAAPGGISLGGGVSFLLPSPQRP